MNTIIDFNDTTASLKTAMMVAKEFRLHNDQALNIIKEVGAAVKQWREVALTLGVSKRECDRMSSAFQYEEAFKA